MSKHRQILAGVLENIRQTDPSCGVVLFGRVACNHERPDSDLDLFVIQREYREIRYGNSCVVHEEDGLRLIRGTIGGIVVDLACWPLAAIRSQICAKPYMFYPFGLGVVLHDPQEMAADCLRLVHAYFHDHPAIATAWTDQLKEVKHHKANPSCRLEFPEWGNFAEHLRTIVRIDPIASLKPGANSTT